MATKSADQITIIDLTDAYSVMLTNDSYTFPGDTNSIKGTPSVTTQVVAMCGAEQVTAAVSAGDIIAPTGFTVSCDGKSPAPTVTITGSEAVTDAGVITIPVVIGDGVTINKQFSYAIAFTGARGATGAAGKGIKSTAVTYQAGASGTTAPTGTWSAAVPTVAEGQYLWSRTVTTYTDNSTSTAYSVAHQGAKGSTGATGKGIKNTAIHYAASTGGTTTPASGWSTTIPTVAAGSYLWTRTTVTYTDNTSSVSYSVAKAGETGAKGDKGDTGEKGDKGDAGAKGADAITLVITSSAGTIFKNSSIATTLTAHVYKAGAEVTGSALTALGTVKWYKDGGSTAVKTGQTLSISAGEVASKVSYEARLEG